MIADDFARHAGFGYRLFQLLIDHLAVGFFDRRQLNRLNILMAEATIGGRQITQAQAQNHQTLVVTQLHRVIHDPHPIVRVNLGTRQFVITQAQQPQATRKPGGTSEWHVEGDDNDLYGTTRTAQTGCRRQHQGHK